MAGLITGKQQTVWQVFNSMAPLDNIPLVIPRTYELLTDVEKQEDFSVGQMDHVLPFLQSVFIDNNTAFPLWVYFPMTNYTLRVSSNMQGIFPVFSPMPVQPRLTLKGGDGSVKFLWCNFAQPYSAWTSV